MDTYAKRHGITPPMVIKVDIEGHEPAFFRGVVETIAVFKPDIILEVLYNQEPCLIDQLRAIGYHFYPITDQGFLEVDSPTLVKRFPLLFLNYLLSARPRQELEDIFLEVRAATKEIDLLKTSKHFPREQWPQLWKEEPSTYPSESAAVTPVRAKIAL